MYNKKADGVKIRLLSPNPLVIQGKIKEKIGATTKKIIKTLNPFKTASKPYEDGINGVIFHIHGGGFVAMSSATHRNHTIRWAKALNKIIFSVDYGLAPDHKYPEGLDDCWQAYLWVVNYSESILGIKTDRIVIAGDSAGGNLSAAITYMAIKAGIRVPDGCYMFYPALNLHNVKYTPSYFLAIDDPILPYNCLMLCLDSYVSSSSRPETDPFLSPIAVSDEILKHFPPCRIATGTNDPLHDDTWRYLIKLLKLNKSVKMIVYPGMPHGFISMASLENFELLISETVGEFR